LDAVQVGLQPAAERTRGVGRFDRGGKTPLDAEEARREAKGLRCPPRFAGQSFGARRAALERRFDPASGGFPHP
jgi:hypothetical protein